MKGLRNQCKPRRSGLVMVYSVCPSISIFGMHYCTVKLTNSMSLRDRRQAFLPFPQDVLLHFWICIGCREALCGKTVKATRYGKPSAQ